MDGVIRDASGNEVWDFFGKWNEFFSIRHKVTGEVREIWKMEPRHSLWDHSYHLTLFGLQLNYIDEHLAQLLPPTDSRFRTDQRALENGDLRLANTEKTSIENS